MEACVLDLVISTFFPNSGRLSNHRTRSRRSTTGPTMAITGGLIPAALPFSTTSVRFPVTVFCRDHVPHWTRATGVAGSIPFSWRVSMMDASAAQPIRTTSVPPVLARMSQGITDSGLDGSSLPLTTVKQVEILR